MFTDQEVEDAVDALLLGQLKRGTLRGGSPDTNTSHEQLLGVITSTLLLNPDAYWYVVWLASNRAAATATQIADLLGDVAAATAHAERPYRPIKSVADLNSSLSALDELATGFQKRKIRNATSSALTRFNSAIERFVSQHLAPNVVHTGDVVDTARAGTVTFATLWAQIQEDSALLVAEVATLAAAYTSFSSIALPGLAAATAVAAAQATIEEMPAKLQGADQALHNRQALLDLFAAKTVLNRIAKYTPPQTVKFQGTAVPAAVVSPPTVTSTAPGPWFVGPGITLDLVVDGVAYSVPIRCTRATLVSAVVTAPGLAVPSQVFITYDFGSGTEFYTYAAPDVVSDAAFLLASNTALGAVQISQSGGRFTIRRENDAPTANLRLTSNTVDQGTFAKWFTGESADIRGDLQASYPTLYTGEELVAAVQAAVPWLSVASNMTVLAEFATAAVSGTTFTDSKVVGSLISTGTTTQIGVAGWGELLPGMSLLISGAAYSVVSVADAVLETLPAIPAGTWSFVAGSDYTSLPVGAPVQVVGSNGLKVWSYVTATLGPSITIQGPAWAWGALPRVLCVSETVTLLHRGTDPAATLEVVAGGGANMLGIVPAVYTPTIGEFTLSSDLRAAGVAAGDTADLVDGAGLTTTVRVDGAGDTLTTAAVPYGTGAWTVEIRNTGVDTFSTLEAACLAFIRSTTYTALEARATALLAGGRYSSSVQAALAAYLADVNTLLAALNAYTVSREPAIDQILRSLEERGLDRGVDLLLSPDLPTLLAAGPAELTYSGWFAQVASDTTRKVAPVSKMATGLLGFQEIRLLAYQRALIDPNRR
jgi:hypothetical protein